MYCKQCGNKLADGVKFCGKCGTAVEPVEVPEADAPEAAPAQEPAVEENVKKPLLYRFNCFLSKLTGGALDMKKRVGDCATAEIERQSISLAWKYLALFGLIALILVFWFVPAFDFESDANGYFVLTGDDEMSVSVGGFGSLMSEVADGEEDVELVGVVFTVLTVIFHVIPICLCALITIMPVLRKRITKRHRLIYPNMTALFCLLSFFFCWLFWIGIAGQEKEFEISVSVNFGGVMLIILLLAWIVLSFGAAAHNKKIVKMIKATEVAPASVPEAPDTKAWQ